MLDEKKLKPIGKQVLFRRDKAEEKKYGSILLPGTRYVDARWGTVIAVGPGRYINGKYIPLEVQPGDRIMVAQYDGDVLSEDDDRLQMVTEDLITCMLPAGTVLDSSKSDD